MPAIKSENFGFSYKDYSVFENINSSLYCGKIYLLLGENGTGKSTFLKIIQKSLNTYTGNATVSHLSYGMIGNIKFYDNLSGLDNIDYFLCDYEKLAFEKYVEMFEMQSYINKKVRKYSLGMKQRLASLIVLLNNLKILLFDEPTNGMDYKAKSAFIEMLLEAKGENHCIIITSHNINDFCDIVDEYIVIKDKSFASKTLKNNRHKIFFSEGTDINKIKTILSSEIEEVGNNSVVVKADNISISEIIQKVSQCDIVRVVEDKLKVSEIIND